MKDARASAAVVAILRTLAEVFARDDEFAIPGVGVLEVDGDVRELVTLRADSDDLDWGVDEHVRLEREDERRGGGA